MSEKSRIAETSDEDPRTTETETWFGEITFPRVENLAESVEESHSLEVSDEIETFTPEEACAVDRAVVSEAETVLNETDDSRTRYVVTELLETCNYAVSQKTVYTVTENTDEDE